jgi:catechol 2,3-dioxygenase-like lactoylglutathione lyase family enzyme
VGDESSGERAARLQQQHDPEKAFGAHSRNPFIELKTEDVSHWGGVVIDSPDPQRLAHFWAAVLGYDVIEDSPGWVVTQDPDGGSPLLVCQGINSHVQHGAQTPQGNRFHLDVGLRPGEGRTVERIQASMSRLEQLGAQRVERVDAEGQPVHWIWADPDGNVFCSPGL